MSFLEYLLRLTAWPMSPPVLYGPLPEALRLFGLHGFSPLKISQIKTFKITNGSLTESCWFPV